MRVLIAGLGAIGRRHLANLQEINPTATPILLRRPESTDRPLPGCQVVTSLGAALAAAPTAAIVAVPATRHLEVATVLAEHGIHLLVEKPLADRSDGVSHFLETARRRDIVVMVGYTFRFYRPLQIVRDSVQSGRIGRVLSVRAEVGQYLPDWRPGSDYREGVSGSKSLGGGALLELSHEIDYVRWIVGEVRHVSAELATIGGLEIDVEDTAEIIMRFENGAVGSVHLDFLQRPATRTLRVVGTDGSISWSRSTHEVVLTSLAGATEVLHPACELPVNQMYLEELRHFFHAIQAHAAPAVTAEDGLGALLVVEAAKRSARERRVVDVARCA
jgi:predicted dehydrogenase